MAVIGGDNVGHNISSGTTLPDGTVLVSGSYTRSTSSMPQSSGQALFAVQSNAVWQQYSEYSFSRANAYFTRQAASEGTTVPRIPADAGRLAVLADGGPSSLVARGVALDGRVAAVVCDGGVWELWEHAHTPSSADRFGIAPRPIADMILQHHERLDGSGYPNRLAGTAIPISARLMAVADVYDALISTRVYKTAMSHERAIAIIVDGAGKHFDPDIVAAFAQITDEFAAIASRYTD